MGGGRFRFFVAIGVLVWTSAINPGHTRGCISLAGTTDGLKNCCDGKSDAPLNKKPVRSSSNCLICFLAAHLTPGSPPSYSLRELGLLPLRVERCIAAAPATPIEISHLSRGPPA